MATEAELETVDTEGQSAPAVTSQKSVTVSDPAVVALSEVKLSSQKTTNKSYKSDCSNITRPEGYLPVGQRPSVPLVQSTIGITSEWLTEVYTMRGFLKEGGKVTSCNVKPLGEGEGVMGLLAICTVELENAEAHAPLQFVAKFSPCKTSMPGFMLRSIFGAEAHWYNDMEELDQGLGRPAAFFIGAKLFHKRFWKRKPVFCMLVEMMPKPLYSRTSGCDNLQHLRLVMTSLASFHARWWKASKKEEPLTWVSAPGTDHMGLFKNALIFSVNKGFPALERCWGDTYKPVLAMKPVIMQKLKWFVREVYKPPLTLCHGDVHLDNIFFDESFPTGMKMIDFGNICIAQAGFDVAYFLAQNIEPELRRTCEAELMLLYHERLVRDGVEGYSLDDCWRSYRLNLFRVLINVMFVSYDQFAADAKRKRGMFAETPTKEDEKLRATYDATNRRMAAALVDAKFDELLSSEGKTMHNPCRFLPGVGNFCA
mmetsp:Transcript_39169/g.117249  ORF Transcript_39169/g.117249 Transcript_39169/m.117249 type:complete len:483 (+) Transcript_39169:75-1523(+)